jgi:hypothetical protein
MNNASKTNCRPRSNENPTEPPSWVRAIESFDRAVRRSNLAWKIHTIRLDFYLVDLIASDRTLPLDMLNELRPVRTYG